MYQLWTQFTLSAVRVIVDVTWPLGEFLVSVPTCSVSSAYHVCIQFVACLIHDHQRDVLSDSVSLHQLRKITQELQRRIRGARRISAGLSSNMGETHLSQGVYDNVRSLQWRILSWNFCNGSIDRCSWAQRVSCVNQLRVRRSCGSFLRISWSGYCQKLIVYPSFDLRFFKRCLHRRFLAYSEVWTGLQWVESLRISWKALRHEIECCLAPPWRKPYWQMIWAWLNLLILWPISLVCRRSSSSIWRT